MLNSKSKVTARTLSADDCRELFNRPKMSDSEAAARLYLGRKQAEKAARIEAVFLGIWAFVVLAAVTAPAWLFLRG